jgi:hypothetical protein
VSLEKTAAEIARTLRREARQSGLAQRYWSGWKVLLSFGPYVDAFDEGTLRVAEDVVEQLTGKRPDATDHATTRAVDRGRWHLSASWRGGNDVGDGRARLGELVSEIGVPESERAGRQPARVFGATGPSAQVTHWIWSEVVS